MDKAIKLATKPKRAAPKAKYIDPIVQGTFSQDGSLEDAIKSLTLRLRDPNTTVIFKSLIVLHSLLRSGSLDPTYQYLAASSISLSLSSTETPNLAAYASYLSARIKAYANLKRDVIRDKSDRRATTRLRSLAVDSGLLREVREVQRMIATLVEAKFYLDDIDDDVSMTALRLLVKDLLVLFQVVNEGVINVLEHYFEMSHTDATTALKIYKTFCKDTEKVVAYLGVAKKLHNILNVQIPNLKHAPVSLAGSLEEYLSDPNFASNREEYKENKRIADGGAPRASATKPSNPVAGSSSTPINSAAPASSTAPKATADFMDFFESIESAQTTMFNPSTDSPTSQYFQQQATFNPFLQQQQPMGMMSTGMGGYGPGGLVPQATGMGYAAFGGGQQIGNPFGAQPQFLNQQATSSPFLRQTFPPQFPQQTSPFGQQMSSPFGGQSLAPQMTGYPMPMPQQPMMTGQPNPFRQTMMITGAQNMSFGGGQQQQQNQPFGLMAPPSSAPAPSTPASPFGTTQPPFSPANSTPTSPFPQANGSSPFAKPLAPQPTGSRNPFAPAPGERAAVPPVPTGPSLNALGGNAFGGSNSQFGNGQQSDQQQPNQQPSYQQQSNQNQQSNPQQQQQNQNRSNSFPSPSTNSFAFGSTSTSTQQSGPLSAAKTGTMGSVASEFALASRFPPSPSASTPPPPPPMPTYNSNPTISQFSNLSLNSNSNPSSNFSPAPTATPSYLTNQATGYTPSTLSKPFTPTSSFGTSLQESLGPSGLGNSNSGGFNPFRGTTGGGTSPGVGAGGVGGQGSAFGNAFGNSQGNNSGFGGQFGANPSGSGASRVNETNGTGGYGGQQTGSLI